MKKTKFMIGALVLSMGLLGTGYAYWTDTLAVSTKVDTGHLNVKFANLESKDTYANDSWNEVDSKYTTFVSTKKLDKGPAEGDYNNDNDLISIEVNELVPGAYTCVTANMVNDGTVAARLAKVIPTISGDMSAELKQQLTVDIIVSDKEKGEWFPRVLYTGKLQNLTETTLTNTLLEKNILFVPGKGVDSDIKLDIVVGLSKDATNVVQEKTGTVDLQFVFNQAFDNNPFN